MVWIYRRAVKIGHLRRHSELRDRSRAVIWKVFQNAPIAPGDKGGFDS